MPLFSSHNDPFLLVLTDSSTSSARPSDHEIQTAREWLEKLHTNTIPKSVGSISFSRASGPGGQNVNKTESKATLKVPLEALLKHVPSALHSEIRSCRYYAKRTDALIFQADESRKLHDNLDSCYAKLHQVVLDAGKSAVPGETSAEQKKHVKSLQKADNERRLKGKKQHSSKKSSRRSRGDD
ncbi:hypothetical protein BU24DRAFT_169648 [Aaosphaeria arxii CBS 175.79]|uniref:Prokaryotic-type class I peptide chain release factors domain-containing protein n=1 Tax=Aaosphaeria arxii CBS 175.79 TaxID=1450172 RepID=A0A6A5XZH4_9PLEO|nr:uncharacterized protein BU24DRAFT_169648 [Aaosphaeria arxii CBS 175.79]KAF2018376.1 hypothetical protein BU24DRAFT_169648 [Aaosphaeria arxii CBS 175.79]